MSSDERPGLWMGHTNLAVGEPARSHDFYVSLGMRGVHRSDDIAITELRGGTHLILMPGETTAGDAPFDLMVEDLSATRTSWAALGHDVSDIVPGEIHSVFVLTDPDGYRIVVYDDHTVGPT